MALPLHTSMHATADMESVVRYERAQLVATTRRHEYLYTRLWAVRLTSMLATNWDLWFKN